MKPYVKQFFKTIHQGFKFYEAYGHKCGFPVCKNDQKKDKFGKPRYKYLRCSHAGISDCKSSNDSLGDDDSKSKSRWIASRRCQCDAELVLKYMYPLDGYVVLSFVEDHNHPLLPRRAEIFEMQ